MLGGDRGQWSGGEVEHDPKVLQGHLHQELQEDHRGGLPGEAAEDPRGGREADAVGHRRPGGVRRHHQGLLPRGPGLRGRLLHHRQGLLDGRQEVEEEGGGRVRRHPDGVGPEQDRPDRPVGDQSVSIYSLQTIKLFAQLEYYYTFYCKFRDDYIS